MSASEIAAAFLGQVAAMNFDRIGAMVADDVVFDFPFARRPQPHHGRAEALENLRAGMGAHLKSLSFQIDATYVCADGETVVIEYSSRGKLTRGGAYANRYVGILRVQGDGRIALFREYFNPLAITPPASA